MCSDGIVRNLGVEENWQAGDQAECLGAEWHDLKGVASSRKCPEAGDVMRVRAAKLMELSCGCSLVMLSFTYFAPSVFSCAGFRKVTPRAEQATRAEAAFIASLKHARIPAPEAA